MRREDAASGNLRILMVAARYLPFAGGIETHVREVGSRLASAGHSVTVLTADPRGDLPASETLDGMRIERVRSFPSNRDWCFAPDLYRRVSECGVDVVHVQGYHTFSAPFAMAGALRAGTPFVLTFHSGGHSSGLRSSIRGLQTRSLGPLARRAAHLVGVSRFEADRFSGAMGIRRDRFSVVPNGASLPTAASLPDAPDPAAPLIISLGRLERYKGHHLAIAAFAELRKRIPGARLRILGEGPFEAELHAMVADLGIGSSVDIKAIPPDRRADLAGLVQSASLVVLLSDYEAHPVAVMEALSLGVPVLTGTGSGFDELAEAGLVRTTFIGTSASGIAATMEALVVGPRGAGSVRNLPTWGACAEALLEIYRNAVNAAHPTRSPAIPISPTRLGRSA